MKRRRTFLITALLLPMGFSAQGQIVLGNGPLDFVRQGNQALNMRERDAALADFQKAIDLDPTCVPAYLGRAKVRLEAEDLDGALADESKAIDLDPRAPDVFAAYFSRGRVRQRQGDMADAMADFTKAISLRPDFAEAYGQRGHTRMESGDWAGGQADLDKAEQLRRGLTQNLDRFQSGLIEPEANSPQELYQRGMDEILRGHREDAMALFNRSIKIGFNFAPPLAERGRLFYDDHDFKSALADFRQVDALLAKDPPNQSACDYNRLRIWLCQARLGERDAANRDLNRYLETRPDPVGFDWPAELARFLTGKIGEAELFKATRDGDPQTSLMRRCEACYYAGSVHLLDGDEAGAIGDFKNCLATSVTTFTEYKSAEAELGCLKSR